MAKGDGSFYEGCAARAREMARTEAGGGASLVKNAGNLELYLFLSEIRDMLQRRGGDSLLSKSLPLAQRSLRDCRWRVCTPALLMKLKGFGEKTAGIVSDTLWKDRRPDEEDEEEREFRKQCEDEAKAQAKALRTVAHAPLAPPPPPAQPPPARPQAAQRGRRAGRRRRGAGIRQGRRSGDGPPLAGGRGAAGGAASTGARARPQRAAPAAEAPAAAGAEGGGAAAPAGPPQKKPRAKAKTGTKLPSPGTGNYCVLAILYLAYKRGELAMTKESIISAVESHPALADTTMRPSNQWSVSSKDKYCGWSNVNKGLINCDPPLVSKHSNPPKYRLVHPHGLLTAATIYKDAVARSKMEAAPGIDTESDIREHQAAVDALAAAAAGGAGASGSGEAGGGSGGGQAAAIGMGDSGVGSGQTASQAGDDELLAAGGRGRGRGRGAGGGRGRSRGKAAAAEPMPLASPPAPQARGAAAAGPLTSPPAAAAAPAAAAGRSDWWGGEDDPSLYGFIDEEYAPAPSSDQRQRASQQQRQQQLSQEYRDSRQGGWTPSSLPRSGGGAAARQPKGRRRGGEEVVDDDFDSHSSSEGEQEEREDWDGDGHDSDGGGYGSRRKKPGRRRAAAAPRVDDYGAAAAGGDGLEQLQCQLSSQARDVDALVEMGFPRARAVTALRRSGTVDAAAEWLLLDGEEEGAAEGEGAGLAQQQAERFGSGAAAGLGAALAAGIFGSSNADNFQQQEPQQQQRQQLEYDDDDVVEVLDDAKPPPAEAAAVGLDAAGSGSLGSRTQQAREKRAALKALLTGRSPPPPRAAAARPHDASGESSGGGGGSDGGTDAPMVTSGGAGPARGQPPAQPAAALPPLPRAGSAPVAAPPKAAAAAAARPAGLAAAVSAPAGGVSRLRAAASGGGSGSGAGGSVGGAERLGSQECSGGCWASDSWEPLPWRVPLLGAPDGLSAQLRVPPLAPGQTFGAAYEVVVLVDQREQLSRGGLGRAHALDLHLNELRRLGVAVEKAHLNCGDMLWIARGRADPSQRYVLDFLAERKSIQDLHGSITGSRYTSQKLNMQGAGLAHLLYIVEGAVDGLSEDRSARQAVRTSVMETAVLDGFRVLEVDDHGATLRLLADITKMLGQLYGPLTAASAAPSPHRPAPPPLPRFDAWNEARRASHRRRTVRDAWLCILCELQGFGVVLAQKVVGAFPTPRALYDAYLAEIRAAQSAGRGVVAAARGLLRERVGLSAAKSAQVYDDLFANGWHVV